MQSRLACLRLGCYRPRLNITELSKHSFEFGSSAQISRSLTSLRTVPPRRRQRLLRVLARVVARLGRSASDPRGGYLRGKKPWEGWAASSSSRRRWSSPTRCSPTEMRSCVRAGLHAPRRAARHGALCPVSLRGLSRRWPTVAAASC